MRLTRNKKNTTTMTIDEIREVISEELCIALSDISNDATIESLGADSLDAVNLGVTFDRDIVITDTVNTIARKKKINLHLFYFPLFAKGKTARFVRVACVFLSRER